jgi:streptomycin 6-kinase
MLEAMTDPTTELPRNLVEAAEREGRTAWLGTVPTTVVRLASAWSLSVEAPFQPGGQTAWVAPVRDRAAGAERVLKVAWAHAEAAHEAQGLRVWAGRGAVRLHAAEESDDTIALLLERCRPGIPLAARPEPEQDQVIGELLPRLWLDPPPGHRFPSLAAMCERWAEEFEAQLAAAPGLLDPGLAREGIALFRALPATADRRVLLATDAHAGNVLMSERGWLLIDPKPHVGDPTYDVLQHLLNCEERLRADPADLVARMAEPLELDPQRLRGWLFARCVQEAPNWPPLADVARRIRLD